jgi:hypothetical protein
MPCGLPKCPNCLGPHGPKFPKCPARPQVVNGRMVKPTKTQQQAIRSIGAQERARRTAPNAPPTTLRNASPARGRPSEGTGTEVPRHYVPTNGHLFTKVERRRRALNPVSAEDSVVRATVINDPQNDFDKALQAAHLKEVALLT